MRIYSHTNQNFRRLRLLAMLALTIEMLVSAQYAHADNTFRARATVQLCPEFRNGNTALLMKYKVGSEVDTHEAQILSQTIDIVSNTGTFDIQLPNNYATTPIQLFVYCKNTGGQSSASNSLSLTNCDALSVKDTDFDSLTDLAEDNNCDNEYSASDSSNPWTDDSDGDQVADKEELTSGTDPKNAASSARPVIFAGAPFDLEPDGNSNAIAFHRSTSEWRGLASNGSPLPVFVYGTSQDVPFVYNPAPAGAKSDVGVFHLNGSNITWQFRGAGFQRSNSSPMTEVNFGSFGDIPVLGPWELPGVTSPAVARVDKNGWTWFIYLRNGSVQQTQFGNPGDRPFAQDWDGDGLFDIATYRPTNESFFVKLSSTGETETYHFGAREFSLAQRGDTTGDDIDDATFWNPTLRSFMTMTSTNGFNDAQASAHDAQYYKELSLNASPGVPLSWNLRSGKVLYTLVDHSTATRYFKNNNSGSAITPVVCGLPGDAQG